MSQFLRCNPAALMAESFPDPVSCGLRPVQSARRILRPWDGKTTAEVHDYHDKFTGVLASSLAKRAPGYTSLCFKAGHGDGWQPCGELDLMCI